MKETSMMELKLLLTPISVKFLMKKQPIDKMRLKEYGLELLILIMFHKSDLSMPKTILTSLYLSPMEIPPTR